MTKGIDAGPGDREFLQGPTHHQPGTVWEYSLSTDMLGRVIEAVSGKRLADFMEERLFKPLEMKDTGFWCHTRKCPGSPKPLPIDTSSASRTNCGCVRCSQQRFGRRRRRIDCDRLSALRANDGQWRQLDGKRYLSGTTVELMTSDQPGVRIQAISPMTRVKFS